MNNLNSDILNLFYVHEYSRIVSLRCKTFSDCFPNLPAIKEQKFRRIVYYYISMNNLSALLTDLSFKASLVCFVLFMDLVRKKT